MAGRASQARWTSSSPSERSTRLCRSPALRRPFALPVYPAAGLTCCHYGLADKSALARRQAFRYRMERVESDWLVRQRGVFFAVLRPVVCDRAEETSCGAGGVL